MKTKFFLTSLLLALTTLLSAQTPGYALYGDVPTDYEDLTSFVQVVAPATISGQNLSSTDHVAPAAEGIAFTGRGHSAHYCQGAADLNIRFSENQSLTLTDKYAIHIKIKRTNAGSGDIQMSFVKGVWGSYRTGYLIAGSEITDEEKDIILKYEDHKEPAGGQYYSDKAAQFIGNDVEFAGGNGNELFRMTAANGEAFLITGIYLEASYTEPTPGPGPEPEPVAEKRYYFVRGGDLPTIDGVTMVDLRAPDNAAWSINQFSNLTNNENGVQFTLPGGWGVAELKPKAQALADVTKAGWHLKMKFETDATHLNGKNLRINIGSNGGGGNLYLSEASYTGVQEMTFALADAANTMTFPVPANNQMFQLHANGGLGGTYFKVIYAYLTNDPSSDEAPVITGDEDAPAGLTIVEKAKTEHEITVTVSATDAQSPITYTFFNGETEVGTASAASGESKDFTFTGLTPSTTYTLGVIAKDLSDNATAKATITSATSATPTEKRFYFFSSRDELPYENVTSVDLRNGAGTTIVWNGGMSAPSATQTTYTSIPVTASWFSFNQNLKAATDMSALAQGGKLVIRMRSNLTGATSSNPMMIRLCNGVSYNLYGETYFDGEWHTHVFDLADAANHPTFNASMSGTIFQFHTNSSIDAGKIDIDFAYLTTDATNQDEGTAVEDLTAPAGLTVNGEANKYNKVTFTFSATDENDEEITYLLSLNGGEAEEVHGASGVLQTKEYTGLTENTSYTLSVIAKDAAGNESAPVEATVTTPEQEPELPVRYYLVGGENTIECNITYGNQAYQDARVDGYLSFIAGNNTWNSITFTPKANVENSLDDDCYIVMRFRSNMNNGNVFGFNNFRVNLVNNSQNYYLNSGEWTPCGDNKWHTVKFKLGDAAGTKPAQYLQAGQIALQLHVNANLVKGDYIDIDYIYFTNDISTLDPGTDTHKKVVLKENQNNDLTSANVDVYFDRGFINDGGQYTLCLPFALDEEKAQQYFPGTYTKLVSSELRGDLIHLNMESATSIEAGVPYLYLPSQNVAAPMTIEDVVIDSEAETTISTTYFSMTGIYSPTALSEGDYFLYTDNYLYAYNPSAIDPLKGFRAYFTIKESVPAGVRARVVFGQHTATGVESAINNEGVLKLLINGQLHILRGDKVYNVQGQTVK